MQCNQLIRLIKNWYIHVKDETMAPARMMQFVDKHISKCEVCQEDPDLEQEVEKIRDFIVPESKIPKAIRDTSEEPTPEISSDEDSEEMDDMDTDEQSEEFDDDLDDPEEEAEIS